MPSVVFEHRHNDWTCSASTRSCSGFHYLDHPDSSETVYIEELRRYLESQKPAEVRLTLETTWDFGTMRGYSLEKVDDIRVNAGGATGIRRGKS